MRAGLSRDTSGHVPRDHSGRDRDNNTSSVVPCPAVPSPRLLNMRSAANYLGISYWTVRDYVLAGILPTVEMPPLPAREGERQRRSYRRTLIDRLDLDAFIEGRKTHPSPPNATQPNGRIGP